MKFLKDINWPFYLGAVLILMLVFAVSRVFAADLQVSWTNATTNTDGSTIPATGPGSLTLTRVEWSVCAGGAFGTVAGTQSTATGTATSLTVSNVGPATWCVRAFHRNTYGNESTASNVTTKVVPTPVPNPPILAVPVIAGMTTTPVYSVAADNSRSTFVGFADVGAPCQGPVLFTYRSKQFREIPRASVKLWGQTSLRLAVPCSAG